MTPDRLRYIEKLLTRCPKYQLSIFVNVDEPHYIRIEPFYPADQTPEHMLDLGEALGELRDVALELLIEVKDEWARILLASRKCDE